MAWNGCIIGNSSETGNQLVPNILPRYVNPSTCSSAYTSSEIGLSITTSIYFQGI